MIDFYQTLTSRGFFHNTSNMLGLRDRLAQAQTTAYIGYDATAPSLHVGHLMNIMLLRWFQKSGHRPITLMGGGTTKVGDPSFRDTDRPLLDTDDIAQNIQRMQRVFDRYLDYDPSGTDTGNAAKMMNNADWLDSINHLDFLRDIGSHFSVNRMLSYDSVKSRLVDGRSLSFLEFNYMVLQAYDFLQLFESEGCVLQMGGSDQWGNIINGIELIRRIHRTEAYAVTTPLITTATGKKMGKSAEGRVIWLDAELTPPFEFWQYWRNCKDEDVLRFLKIFTERDVAECEELCRVTGEALNDAKVILADEVTALLHGEEAAATARQMAANGVLSQSTLGLPVFIYSVGDDITVAQALVRVGVVTSAKEGKRLIRNGGVKIDNTIVSDTSKKIHTDSPMAKILSVGKHHHVVLKFTTGSAVT